MSHQNRTGTSFGGPFVYGKQPGMTKGDTIGRYCSHIEDSGPNHALAAALRKAAEAAGKQKP